MLDVAAYSRFGKGSANFDSLRYELRGDELFAVVCDVGCGADERSHACEDCSRIVMDVLLCGHTPEEALAEAELSLNKHAEGDGPERVSACALSVTGGLCRWANIGDCRLYGFSGGVLKVHSVDDSAAYKAFEAGETSYEELRLHPLRCELSACLGDGSRAAFHSDELKLAPGDALILCSDGFWQYIYETEMEIDLVKASGADAWLKALLLRLAFRSRLEGDSLSALCCRRS